MAGTLNEIRFAFKKGSNNLEVSLDCKNPEGGDESIFKQYNFKYRGKADADDLRIGIDLNGEKAEGRWDDTRRGNLLEFFSQASWLYLKSPQNNWEIIGINQLASNGYSGKIIPMVTKSDFIEARGNMANEKGQDRQQTPDGYNVAEDVPGILLVLTEE